MDGKREELGPIYFGVVVWGRTFCESFVNYALSSLLAEGNIPALDNVSGENRFLIVTTAEDKQWLEKQVLVKLLQNYMIVEFIEIVPISDEQYQKLNNPLGSSKWYTMTLAHRQILNRMYADKAIASLVFPDSIYANGSIHSAYQYIENGKTSVHVYCPRFSTTSLINELPIQEGRPITIESRDLVVAAMRHLHVDILMQQWEAPYVTEFALDTSWVLPDESGMLFHAWSCWYVFINYGKLSTHNVESLGNNTVDGIYCGDNLKQEDSHFITDSDEFLLISFSSHIPRRLTPFVINRHLPTNKIKNLLKIVSIKKFLKESVSMKMHTDLFKLSFARQPIFMHTKDLTPACYAVEDKAQVIINKILEKELTFFEELILFINNTDYLGRAKNMIINLFKTGYRVTWRFPAKCYRFSGKAMSARGTKVSVIFGFGIVLGALLQQYYLGKML